MRAPPHFGGVGSSGHVLADKRYAYAEALAAEGDDVAAADLFGQAAEEAPDWAAAYLAQGLALQRLGDNLGAREALRAAVARDPQGLFGAALHLGRLQGAAPAAMPKAYVETLFDQYAPRFDAHLVDGLGYRGPQVIVEALSGLVPADGAMGVLDLGCGTGLMARAFAQDGLRIDGIDLSGAMLAQAEATGLYRQLWRGDCAETAGRLASARYDLVVAADVLVYLGDLAPLFAEVARVLRPGGLFAATVQAQDGAGYSLGDDLRFRHGQDYLHQAFVATKLHPLRMMPCVTRQEGGIDVPGLVFVGCRP